MKTFDPLSRFTLIILALVLVLAGCRKKETEEITEEDAADAISYAIESSYGGLASDVSNTAEYAMDEGYGKTEGAVGVTLQCGVPYDTTINRVYNGTVSATYMHNWILTLGCNGNIPESLALTGTYSGTFISSRMESSNSGTRNWIMTGVLPSAAAYTVNGSFVRNGSHTSKVRNKNTFTVAINTQLTNITVDKATYRITGGTGACNAVCNVSNGDSYTFDGTIVFNSNNTATLTINGNSYIIQLY